jgi:hypothetical protein
MEKLRVSILGASKFGRFHAREFNYLGAKVVAILGSSNSSATKTSKKLKKEFGIKTIPYENLETLLKKEKLDVVSICTPAEFHKNQIKKCLDKKIHVFCEKPLIQGEQNNYEVAKDLFNLAKKNKRILTMNIQWVALIDAIKKEISSKPIKNFKLYMEPGKKGIEMLNDHLSHANSLLIRLISKGNVSNIKFIKNKGDLLRIVFDYGNKKESCFVEYIFKFKKDRPRKISFSINDIVFTRLIGKNYRQSLMYNGKITPIEDPLRISILNFLEAIKKGKGTLFSKTEILKNIKIQEKIISEYKSIKILNK